MSVTQENAGRHILSTKNSLYNQASPSLKWLHSLVSLTQEDLGKMSVVQASLCFSSCYILFKEKKNPGMISIVGVSRSGGW